MSSNDEISNPISSIDNTYNQTQNNEKFSRLEGGEQQVVVRQCYNILAFSTRKNFFDYILKGSLSYTPTYRRRNNSGVYNNKSQNC